MNSKIAAAILAGGKPRPIGSAMSFRLQNILQLIDTLKKAGFKQDEIVIVADDPIPFWQCNVRVIADKRKNIGPLAGIESALDCYCKNYSAVLILPADVQNLTVQDVIDLQKAYTIGGTNVVFAETKYNDVLKYFPLCVVMNCSILSDVKSALDLGERHALPLWRRLKALTINCNERGAEGMFLPNWKKQQAVGGWSGVLFNKQKEDKK